MVDNFNDLNDLILAIFFVALSVIAFMKFGFVGLFLVGIAWYWVRKIFIYYNV
jgi:hypothetical protein